MKRIVFCCLLLAGLFIHTNSFSQCTPDPNCTPAQLICPATLPNGCEGEPYLESLTISLGPTIAGFALTNVGLDSITGLPPGFSFSCTPANCVFPANSNSCILITGPGAPAGTYNLRGYLKVNVGIVVAIDTPLGAIIILPLDCNGDCGGTASIDACGICSGGNTGILPNCDDGNPCTLDDCDGLGECINTLNTCDDTNLCTTDSCGGGNCFNTPIVCDDSDVCTDDACVDGNCEFTPVVFANTSHAVDASGMSFTPQDLNITVGDTVVWNATEGFHNINGSTTTFPSNPESFFNGAPAGSPWTFSHVFTIAGTYDYQCDVHFSMGMVGTITVAEAIDCSPDTICPQLAFDYNFPCGGETGTVTNVSTGVDSAATYYIDLNDDGSIEFSLPAIDFPTDSSFTVVAGTATFTVIVVNSNNCSDTLTLTVTTPVTPVLAFDYNFPCESEVGTVTNVSTGVDAGATYYIDLDADGSIELSLPAADFPVDSSFTVGAGTATFSVIVVNSTGCSDTLTMTVTTPEKPQLGLSFSASPCEGEAVTVTNLSTGVDAGATYYLDVNSNGTINLTFPASSLPTDSSLVLPVPAGTTGFTIYVVNSTGCSDTLVSDITILENPELAFDYNFPCEGEVGTVTNVSTGVDAGATYYIDLDADGSIELSLPAADFPVDSSFTVGGGIATFSVIVVNSTGCSDTLTMTVTTPEKPQLGLSFSSSPCEGDFVTVTNLSTGVDAGATYFLDVNSNGTINLVLPATSLPTDSSLVLPVPAGTTGFTIYVVNSTGCSDTLVSDITILEKPELALSFSSSPCEGEFVTVTNLSSGVDAGATYYLDVNSNGTINLVLPAASLPTDSSLVLPVPAGTTGFTIYVVNSTGCSDTLVSDITILEKPELALSFSSSPCEGEFVTVTNLSSGVDAGATYYLDVNSNGTINLVLPAASLPTDSSLVLPVPAGTTGFTIYVVNSTGCSDTLVSSVTVLAKPQLAFDYQNTCSGEPTSVVNQSTNVDPAGTYSLDLYSDGSIDLSILAANLPPDSLLLIPLEGDIDFTVYVVNPDGCSDTLVASIEIVVCDDGDSCTTDLCDLGQCFYTPIPGCGSGNPCDTLVCDDGDGCTTDACLNGQCEYTPVPCTDNDACTNDTCVNAQCVFTPVVCDDGDGCTSDACVNGQCEYTPVVCDDFDACTTDSCVSGLCEFTPVLCTDNDSCTIDACINGICEFTPVNCDDNDSCTVDLCQSGQCLNIPVDCTDGDPCTNDICQSGQCSNIPVDCSDGDACTDDLCINGSCFNQPIDCDDGNPCTTDFCDGTGTCQNTTIPNCCQSVADCDDTNECTEDVCNGGICLHISTCCDDNDLCTIDVCDPIDGSCQFIALYCDDGDACTTNGCDNGVCTFTPINCDDSDACTTDACVNGNCIHTPQNCDDGDPCTTDFCDLTGTCQNLPVLCDDADLCTNDSCVQGICIFIPVLCDDGNLCTVDKCVLGTCVFTQNDCDDFDICTDDYCINGTCFHDAIANCCIDSTQCDDADACTEDLCDNNQCVNNSTNTDVTITEHLLPSFCQGSGVILKAASASATGYEWSTGETTESIQVVAPGTYTVTATNAGGCPAVASYTVTFDATALLSSYVIVAQKEVDLSVNTVHSGGVGVTRSNGKVKVRNNSVITAAGTFVKADNIAVSGGSAVTTPITTEASLTLPTFETNPFCALGQDLNIPPNSNITLNGSLYNGITVGNNSIVTFTAADINLENIFTKSNVTIKFTSDCVKLRICKKLQLGSNNSFNLDSSDVIAYVVQDVTISSGTSLIGDIYMTGGKMTVLAASGNDPNELTGLFMVNILQAGSNTNWYQNPACDAACNNQQPAQCQGNDRRVVSLTLVNANTDQDMGTINDGDIIDICQTPVNIRANVCDEANIESVRFLLNGNNYRMENLPFYTIAGDNNGNYLPWNIAPGVYTIRAIPFAGNNGTGAAGIDHSVTVTIVCSSPRLSNPNQQTMNEDMIEKSVMLKGYPNLFSDKLNIEFSLPQQGRVTLDIVDIAGNRIAELFNGVAEGEKTYKMEFNAGSNASGMIFYRLQTESGVYYDKAVIVKE